MQRNVLSHYAADLPHLTVFQIEVHLSFASIRQVCTGIEATNSEQRKALMPPELY